MLILTYLWTKAKKIYSFSIGRNLIQILLLLFLCLCLGPAPLILTKLLKIPIALIRRIKVRIIIFLDDVLVMAQTLKENSQAKRH